MTGQAALKAKIAEQLHQVRRDRGEKTFALHKVEAGWYSSIPPDEMTLENYASGLEVRRVEIEPQDPSWNGQRYYWTWGVGDYIPRKDGQFATKREAFDAALAFVFLGADPEGAAP